MEIVHIDELRYGKLRRALDAAVDLAHASKHTCRHGAVLIVGRKLYGGINEKRPAGWTRYDRRRSYRVERPHTMHAEINAMHGVSRSKIRNSTIIVVRIGRRGELRNSKPCSTCEYEMRRKGVKVCYFSLSPTNMGKIRL